MKVMQRLLLALDFGPTTASTVAHAVQLSKTFEAPLVLLHAIEYIPYYPYYPYADDGMREIRRHVDDELDGIQRRIEEAGAKVEGRVVEIGRAHRVIVKVADDRQVNAIIMGAGKKGMMERLLAGTTAEKVVHGTQLPVFLHHPGDPHGRLTQVTCAVDLSPSSRHTLRTALVLCRLLGADLRVLHVSPKPAAYPGLPDLKVEVVDLSQAPAPKADAATVPDAASALRDLLASMDLGGVKVVPVLRHGKPHEEITQDAEGQDLLIMGARDDADLRHLLMGSTVNKVLRQVHCSLLIMAARDLFQVAHDRRDPAGDHPMSVSEVVDYLATHYAAGKELLDKGLLNDALVEFDLCLRKDTHFDAAYEAMADIFARQGNQEKARLYRGKAEQHRRFVWEQKVQADIRRQHHLFG